MRIYHILFAAAVMGFTATSPFTDASAQPSLLESGANASIERFAIVPEPLSLQPKAGYFAAEDSVQILIAPGDSLAFEAKHLERLIRAECGMLSGLRIGNAQPEDPHIVLMIDPAIKAPEGYKLEVTTTGIRIAGSTPNGVFYGIETLRQLISPGVKRQFTVPCVTIEDEPRFAYRGMMLDPARHFLPVEDIKRFIDAMAMYKFNVLHLHLTDDQGWRVEIKKYPRLTEVGSIRAETDGDGTPHGGFYTQEQLKALVRYAAERNVEIVPEVEMPGHTVAALAAYPSLGCGGSTGAVTQVRTTPGLDAHILCMGNDSVYSFIGDVIGELATIFPSKHVHIGGDAAPLGQWNGCPKCRSVAQRENLPDSCRMLSYFIGRVNQSLQKYGKRPMVWYEVNDDMDYPQGSVAYAWRKGVSTEQVIANAGSKDSPVICAPSEYAYFDFPQWQGEEMAEKMPLLSLKQTYEFDPGYGVTAEESPVIGLEATLWGEYMTGMDRIFYMTFPRALALSEAGWSRMDRRSWNRFSAKLHWQLSRLMLYGINFRQPTEVYHQ